MYRQNYILLVLLILSAFCLEAQNLCDGNLGANIFEDGDFGVGSPNNVEIDPGIAPGYQYSNESRSPADGEYTLNNSTSQWAFNYNTWLNIGDNSNDPDGYMMVVNASFEPGLFYEQEVEGLCENTLYQFSADVINMIQSGVPDHTLPNIDFLIGGLVKFSTGDVPQDAEWHEYGFSFTTDPGQTSVKLSLRNNAPGGNGNDLALDNISFRACGPDAFVDADETIFICPDRTIPIEIRAEINALDQAIQWQFSTDSLSWMDIAGANTESYFHQLYDTGNYYYRYLTSGTENQLQNVKCRVISDVLELEVLPLHYAVKDTICQGGTVEFGTQELTTGGAYYYEFISDRGCDSFVDLELTVQPIEQLSIEEQLIDPNCHDSSDGSIILNIPSGLHKPYGFSLGTTEAEGNAFNNLSSGIYVISVTDARGCTQEVSYQLNQPDEFLIELPSDITVALGDEIQVEVVPNEPIVTLSWEPSDLSPCDNCESFSYFPISSQTISATATNEKDCITTAAMEITLNVDNLRVFIPAVISLTALDENRVFTIGSKPNLIKNILDFSVYDRWGNLVHKVENSSSLELWNGRSNNQELSQGVYTYLLRLELLDEKTYDFAGSITLLK